MFENCVLPSLTLKQGEPGEEDDLPPRQQQSVLDIGLNYPIRRVRNDVVRCLGHIEERPACVSEAVISDVTGRTFKTARSHGLRNIAATARWIP
jgi:hypothetical protein